MHLQHIRNWKNTWSFMYVGMSHWAICRYVDSPEDAQSPWGIFRLWAGHLLPWAAVTLEAVPVWSRLVLARELLTACMLALSRQGSSQHITIIPNQDANCNSCKPPLSAHLVACCLVCGCNDLRIYTVTKSTFDQPKVPVLLIRKPWTLHLVDFCTFITGRAFPTLL